MMSSGLESYLKFTCALCVMACIAVVAKGRAITTYRGCNPLYTVRELRLLFEDAQPRYVVIARPFATTAIQAITQSAQVNFKYDSSPELIITELGDLQSTPRRYLINALALLTHARRRQKAQHSTDSSHHPYTLSIQSEYHTFLQQH